MGRALPIRKCYLCATVCFRNTTYPIRSQDIFCFFIFVVGLNFKWIPTTTVLLKQGHCFWGGWGWLLTRWNWWGTWLFHEFKFLDIKKKKKEPDLRSLSNNNKFKYINILHQCKCRVSEENNPDSSGYPLLNLASFQKSINLDIHVQKFSWRQLSCWFHLKQCYLHQATFSSFHVNCPENFFK